MAIDHTNRTTDDTRQGETGHGVRFMLGYGLVLAVIAMGLAAAFAW